MARRIKAPPIIPTVKGMYSRSALSPMMPFGRAPIRQLDVRNPSAVPIYFSGIHAKMRNAEIMLI